MATRLKDGRYQARKRLPDGTRIAGYGKSPEEATADLQSKLAEVNSIPLTVHQGATLHDLAHADWKPQLAQLKPLSRKKYEGIYANWVRDAIGHLRPQDITKAHIQNLVNEAATETGASTAAFIRSVCHQLLRCAEERDMVSRNVARFVKLPPKPPKRERVITLDAASALLESVRGTELMPGLMPSAACQSRRNISDRWAERARS